MRAGRDGVRSRQCRSTGRRRERFRGLVLLRGGSCRTATLASHACSKAPSADPVRAPRPRPRRPLGPVVRCARRISGRVRDADLRVMWWSVRSAVVDVLDTYSGHTDPGGAAARRDLGALTITKVSVGPMDNNAYLLVCTATGEALLIDAANEPDRLAGVVGAAKGAQLRTTVTTHRHYDHWQALGAVAEKFGTRQLAHPLDAPELPVPVDDDGRARRHDHGRPSAAGGHPPARAHARARSPWCTARADGPHLFTGDSLFPGGPGKTSVARRLRLADGRPGGAGVRHPAGRDVGLPRPRRRHHARRRAPVVCRSGAPAAGESADGTGAWSIRGVEEPHGRGE